MPPYQGRTACPYYKPRDDAATQHLMVGNLVPSAAACIDALRTTLSRFGEVSTLQPASEGASHCWTSFADVSAAAAARAALAGARLQELGGRPLVVQHAALRRPKQTEEEKLAALVPAATDASSMGVPGLLLLPDFLSEAEEAALLAAVDASPWLELAHRRVQHYGRGFDYCARKLDAESPYPPIPPPLRPVVQRLEALPGVEAIDQLTANEYAAGVGIAPHSGERRLLLICTRLSMQCNAMQCMGAKARGTAGGAAAAAAWRHRRRPPAPAAGQVGLPELSLALPIPPAQTATPPLGPLWSSSPCCPPAPWCCGARASSPARCCCPDGRRWSSPGRRAMAGR